MDPNEKDPWKHRSERMRCRTCMFFVEKSSNAPISEILGSVGRCRRRAPTRGGYPVVYEADWCGEHKLDENK